MKIGILETGPVVDSLVGRYGQYHDFFARLIHPHDDTITFVNFVVHQNEMPDSPTDADGWLITGSKYGAYEEHSWIPPLETFLRDALANEIPVAGICFGHQILAQAMGGMVVNSDKGWGLGPQDYELINSPSWLTNPISTFRTNAVHQDQVVTTPENTTVLARNDFCEFAALAYGDPEAPIALTVQPHPEFDAEFTADLIEARRGSVFPEDLSDKAMNDLGLPLNNVDWGRWITSFFHAAWDRRKHQA